MGSALLRKLRFLVIFILFSLLVIPTGTLAAKKKTSSKKTKATKTVKKATKGVSIGVSARRKGQNVVITFTKLKNVKTIFYSFSYLSNGVEQGAEGTIAVGGSKSITRVVYLGTCSAGVCTPHTGLSNGILEVTVTYKNGLVQTGRYRVPL